MEALTPPVTKDTEGEIIFEFTFELRKKAPELKEIFSCINKMQQHPSYELSFGLVTEVSRIFWIKSYEHTSEHPTLQFNRKLKSVSNDVKKAITKLNFALAHDAKVLFTVEDNEIHFTATVLAPKSTRRKDFIIDNFKLL